MMLRLHHAQTLRIGQLARMRRLCNGCLISALWELVLWLIVLERRTPCKGLDFGETSCIICSGLIAIFGGQAALDAGKSRTR